MNLIQTKPPSFDTLKDLTPELQKQEDKDRFYLVDAILHYLPARQDVQNARPIRYFKRGWGSVERIESRVSGSPTAESAPKRGKKKRTGEGEWKDGNCHSFKLVDGNINIDWGAYGGIFKNTWRRTLDAKAAYDYEYPKSDLMKVYPRVLKLPGPIDSQAEGKLPLIVQTPRPSTAKLASVQVEEFYDWIAERPFQFIVEVDSACTINEEKFVEMLKSFNTLDSFGPAKRGEIEITMIKQISASSGQLKLFEDSIQTSNQPNSLET